MDFWFPIKANSNNMDEDMLSPDVVEYHRKLANEQKYKNYEDMVNTIKFLEHGGDLTQDWIQEHKERILKYRSWIPNFANLHSEIESEEFRVKCWETEVVIQQLCNTINEAFNVDLYLNLITNMKYICDSVFTDKELEELFVLMSV
jgi:hypothetical protein